MSEPSQVKAEYVAQYLPHNHEKFGWLDWMDFGNGEQKAPTFEQAHSDIAENAAAWSKLSLSRQKVRPAGYRVIKRVTTEEVAAEVGLDGKLEDSEPPQKHSADDGRAGDEWRAGCVFCSRIDAGREPAWKCGAAASFPDAFPVSEGHILVMPRRHVASVFEMDKAEWSGVAALLRRHQKRATAADATITGFNIGVNDGESAGQTIGHVHVHLIPRRDGDVANPAGGVRAVIPEKKEWRA